ncbi:hypothetical protein BT69DRAFT_638268 [Atractiella rhizophila]|nr:hypothetical protein BT69DRAFT_638268 [Atractiella rhizophila]
MSEQHIHCSRCQRLLGRLASFSRSEQEGKEVCYVCAVVQWRVLHTELEKVGREIGRMMGRYSEPGVRVSGEKILKEMKILETHPMSPFTLSSKRNLLKQVHGQQDVVTARARLYVTSQKLEVGMLQLPLICLYDTPTGK